MSSQRGWVVSSGSSRQFISMRIRANSLADAHTVYKRVMQIADEADAGRGISVMLNPDSVWINIFPDDMEAQVLDDSDKQLADQVWEAYGSEIEPTFAV